MRFPTVRKPDVATWMSWLAVPGRAQYRNSPSTTVRVPANPDQ
jgi:hypothetical protein